MVDPRYRRLLPFALALGALLLFGLPWLVLKRAEHRPLALAISTGQAGGVYQPLAAAIAGVVSKDHPRLSFTFQAGDGSPMSVRRLEAGDCDLALIQNGTPGGDGVRVLAPLYEEVLHILVPTAADTRRLEHLRGKRIAIGPRESGTQLVVERLLDHYGLGGDEVVPSATDLATGCAQLLAGELDAVFVVAGVHAEAIGAALATGEVRLIGIGEPGEVGGEIEGLQLHFPNLQPYVLPVGTYRGRPGAGGEPPAPVQTLAVQSLLVATEDLPDRAAAQITRSVFQNRAALLRAHPAAGRIHEPDDFSAFSYPVHAGAEDYYRRHEPPFFVAYAEVIGLLLALAATVWGALASARRWMHLRKKDRIDEYYVQIEAVLTRLQTVPELSREELRDMEQTLAELRHRAVQQLVAEQLEADESFRIFQVLLGNSQSEVRRRIDALE